MFTLNQAKSHLAGLRNLAVEENRYLSCVTDYLRFVKTDVLTEVRGDQFRTYKDVQDLVEDIRVTERVIKDFFRGV